MILVLFLINGKEMNKRLYPFINIYLLYRESFFAADSLPRIANRYINTLV
jgi:hypothetical protein